MDKSISFKDILNKISEQMEKKKEIEELLDGMIKFTKVLFPDENIDGEIQKMSKPTDISYFRYIAMSTRDAIKDILSGYEDWVPESYVIELLRGGGKDIKNETITQELSRVVNAGDIDRNKKEDVNYYKINKGDKRTKVSSASNLITQQNSS